MKNMRILLGVLLIALLFPLRVSAASEGDVYAALRSIGVPESYVSQAAGVLARGTSDGAGVYRSDGTYYSYDRMVSYVYANRETILLYCGIDPDTGGAVTSSAAGTTTAAAPGSTDAATTTMTLPISAIIDEMFADDTITAATTTLSETTTTTTAAATTTTAASSASTERTTRSAVSVTDAEDSGKGGGVIAAACMILAAIGGLLGISLLQRRSQ